MYKACSKCGKIHEYNKKCYRGESRTRRKNTNANNFRKTTEWKKKSEEIREASKYLCSVCFDEGIYNYNGLEVHHIEKVKDRPDLLLDRNNLICLCIKHHKLADAGMISKEYLYKLVEERESKM